MNWKREYGVNAINFSLNILRFPSFQSLTVLPMDIRRKYSNNLTDFATRYLEGDKEVVQEFEWNQLSRLISYIDEVEQAHSEAMVQLILQRDFKNFYTQYDQRRNKNFAETFPALAEWYDSI